MTVKVAAIVVSVLFALGFWDKTYSSDFTIDNAPTKQAEILIQNDYELLKAIYKSFPSSKRKLMPLHVFVAHTELNSFNSIQNGAVQIGTQNNRGIWLHELAHYFSNQLDSSDSNEFAHEVIENMANGMSAETYRKYFKINNNGIYRRRD